MKTPITDALRAKHNIARMGCEDLFEQLQAFEIENLKLTTVLEWLDRKGGLGLDVHERINAVLLKKESSCPAESTNASPVK